MLQAVALTCTLKPSPETSHTQALMNRVVGLMAPLGVETETIRMGVRSAVAQLVVERLDGSYSDADPDTGQFPLCNKVGGVVVTGNEDGAHAAAETTLFNLSHFGCTIPPDADCYWVGDAGPGPGYPDAGGERHMYTNKAARFMAHNLVLVAGS